MLLIISKQYVFLKCIGVFLIFMWLQLSAAPSFHTGAVAISFIFEFYIGTAAKYAKINVRRWTGLFVIQ